MPRVSIPFLETRHGGSLPVMQIRIGVSDAEVSALREIGESVPEPDPIEADALVDTGAMRTFVPAEYVRRLGLISRGRALVAQPLSEAVGVSLFDVSITLIARDRSGWRTVVLAPTVQAGVLPDRPSGPRRFPMPILGRDVLGRCSFLYNGPRTLIEFDVPRRGLRG